MPLSSTRRVPGGRVAACGTLRLAMLGIAGLLGCLPSGEPGVAISAIWAFMIIDPSPNLLYSGVPNRTSTLTLAAKRAFHFPRGTDVVLKFA